MPKRRKELNLTELNIVFFIIHIKYAIVIVIVTVTVTVIVIVIIASMVIMKNCRLP